MSHSISHRGVRSNPDGRFENQRRQAFDDGWDHPEDALPPLATTVMVDATRTIITRNDSPDIAFDRSINPYRGCEHGCAYCFARPGHSYLGLSPGLDFETKLFAKPEAARLLERELRKRSYRPAPIAFGTNTDPYQPIEGKWRVMRHCLEVLRDFNHPLTIVTKGHLITRDLDILAPMAARRLVHVGISLTTLDRDLCRRLEPRASVPAARIRAIRALTEAGIPVTAMVAPIIPMLTDHELERILAAAAAAGASSAIYILLRLPHEVKDLFAQWLGEHRPERAAHILSLLSQNRHGRLNDPRFGARMKGHGHHADLLAQRFHLACRKFGLHHKRDWDLDCSQFAPPHQAGDQLALL
ncbi:PA0069 family radical SAM protein [Magnetospirillum sulfuroxidans]|uniref:PA0069 family radical SAM protein n=1 Tax=Magnetospirillum sulfuroxidans TaxID=611300 RepID=A0ABS5IAD3_9PROT|nr:PA0069 family radical SAM protein [Magnetospirillum sulfuroxidans]MBR9971391.1 PA0069 family radical SAM protein [Magnetospirillum sulfuroxidans]